MVCQSVMLEDSEPKKTVLKMLKVKEKLTAVQKADASKKLTGKYVSMYVGLS